MTKVRIHPGIAETIIARGYELQSFINIAVQGRYSSPDFNFGGYSFRDEDYKTVDHIESGNQYFPLKILDEKYTYHIPDGIDISFPGPPTQMELYINRAALGFLHAQNTATGKDYD